jgi:deoxyribonuclease-4
LKSSSDRPGPDPAGSDLGAHVSVAGGLHNCFEKAREIGARSLQIFVKNQRQWAARPLEAADLAAFASAWRAAPEVRAIVAHATYLVNLAAVDDAIFEKSVACFADELARAEALGLLGVVVHPGSSRAGREAGIARIAAGLERAMRGSAGRPILEGTPGGGGQVGGRFEDLRAIIDALPARLRGRVGVCIDTCHLHVAGYGMCGAAELDATISELNDVIGIDRLRVIHLNDSKGKKGSRLDRHANLGHGTIGVPCFEAIVNDPRLAGIPKILETPHKDDLIRQDMALLRSLRAAGAGDKERRDGLPGRRTAARR